MRRPTSVIIFIASLLSGGCEVIEEGYVTSREAMSNLYLIDNSRVSRASNWVLPRETSFYIAVPLFPDPSVAELVADTVHGGFHGAYPRVVHGEEQESFAYARTSAQMAQAQFLLYPRLLAWDDAMDTWREVRDGLRYLKTDEFIDQMGLHGVQVHLILMEVSSGKIIDTATLSGNSGFLSFYNNGLDQLLADSVALYVNSLQP